MRALFLCSVAVLALVLAACDGGTPDPEPTPPTACGTVVERADTVFVAVGDSTALDLDALFAGVAGGLLRYNVAGAAPLNGAVALRGDRGQAAFVRATAVGARSFTLQATGTCGGMAAITAQAVVALHGVRPGTVCTVPPRAVPSVAPWRFAVGGVPELRPLIGDGGFFTGTCDETSRFLYSTSPLASASTIPDAEDGAPRFRLVPGARDGAGEITVTATDACYRSVQATVALEAVESPTCALSYDPSKVDYLPLTIGRNWQYHSRYRFTPCSTPQCNAIWTESWTVTDEGRCVNGGRTYFINVIKTLPTGTTSARTIQMIQRGDTTVFEGYRMIRFQPTTAPDSVGFGHGNFPYSTYSIRLRRGVGVSSIYSRSGSTHSYNENWLWLDD